MKPRISVITLGVDDLERSFAFYRDGLGLKSEGIIGKEFEYGAVAFFDLEGGARLALWPRSSLSRDSGLPVTPASPTDLSLGHNVGSKDAVDAVMKAGRAGWRQDRESGGGAVLRRLRGLLPGSRRPSVGGRLEPGVQRQRLRRQGVARRHERRSSSPSHFRGLGGLRAVLRGQREPDFCWCTPYRVPSRRALSDTAKKATMRRLIDAKTPIGVLAYDGDVPIGWCSIAPRETYVRLERSRTMPRVTPPATRG